MRDAWQGEFEIYRQVMHWFDVGDAAADFAPGRMPIFIWMYGDGQEDYMYGFPSADAQRPGLKVATEQYARTTTPATLDRKVDAAETEAMHRACWWRPPARDTASNIRRASAKRSRKGCWGTAWTSTSAHSAAASG